MLFLEYINNTCERLEVLKIVLVAKRGLDILIIGIPIILILIVMLDLVKCVIASNEDGINKNKKLIVKRFLYSLAIFFVYTIVKLAFGLPGLENLKFVECWENATTDKIATLEKKITFDANGGILYGNNIETCGGSSMCTIESLPMATLKGHTFVGWDYNSNCSNIITNDYITITGDTIVYACYEEGKSSDNNYSTTSNGANNRKNYDNQNEDNNKSSIEGNSTVSTSTENIIYIGDSRTVGMCNTVQLSSTEQYIAEVGISYNWFVETAVPKVNEILTNNSTKIYTIVINLGANNLYGGNASTYTRKYNELKNGIWSKHNIMVVSVDPVDEVKYTRITNMNTMIKNFNSSLKANISSEITYCHTYTTVYNLIYKDGMVDSNITDGEGLHYNNATYQIIYDKLKTCLN